jgi:predicted nucleotidyltransferase
VRSFDPDIARVEREGIAAFEAVPLEGLQEELRHGCMAVVRIECINVLGPKPGALVRSKFHQPRGAPIDPDASWSNFCYTAGMGRDQAIAKLKEHEAELRQLGIEHLYLFGSTARGEAREDSDVDLFFDHPVGSIGLYELMDVKETASRILGRKADIMTRRSLHRVLRDRIEASALQVF